MCYFFISINIIETLNLIPYNVTLTFEVVVE